MKTITILLFTLMMISMHLGHAAGCDNASLQRLEKLEGDWRVLRDDSAIGHVSYRIASGGCALLEKWQATDGTEASALHWAERVPPDEAQDETPQWRLHQVYIESSGRRVMAEGAFEGDVLVTTAAATIRGEDVLLRATLHGIGTDHVVHITDVSKDDGRTWQRLGTLHYYRAKSAD